jgi:hypothetical protein
VRRLLAVATRTERQPAPRGVPKVRVAKSLQPPAPTLHNFGQSNRNITAGRRCVELEMNSRYRGVNTHRPVVNSWVDTAVTRT